ncbi:MAG: hypothetical protein Kow00105_05180 [Phycisphaeraceae bacterium]
MLPDRDTALNYHARSFDIPYRMSPECNNEKPDPVESAAKLVHELANLLDGSLRHLSLAIDTLSRHLHASDPEQEEQLLQSLRTTDTSMRQMVSLIRNWMKDTHRSPNAYVSHQSLGEALEQAVQIHRPLAERHQVILELDLQPEAAETPAGPVFPIVANGILNAIQAIAANRDASVSAEPLRRVTVSAEQNDNDVVIRIIDDGPGLDPSMIDEHGQLRIGHTTRPDGHGLGLTLSREIAQSLDGKLTLTNRPESGAVLMLRYPVRAATRNLQTSNSRGPSSHA